jgi:hypothetical protein
MSSPLVVPLVDAPGRSVRSLKVVRAVSAGIVLLAVVALGLMTLGSAHTVTKHTTVTRQAAPTAATQPPTDASASPAAGPVTADDTSGLAGTSPLAAVAPDPSVTAITPPVTTAPATLASSPAVSSPSPSASTSPASPTAVLPVCPLALSAPKQSGGLASLIGLSPLFGPFSAEAFASAAAFQPVLQLFGPFLVEFATGYAAVQPSLAPLIGQLQSLENQGFSVLSPLYGPYRTEVLSAETGLAKALAPFAQLAVSNPASSCLVDIEGILTSASPT